MMLPSLFYYSKNIELQYCSNVAGVVFAELVGAQDNIGRIHVAIINEALKIRVAKSPMVQ